MNNSSFTYDNTSVRTEVFSKKHPDVVAQEYAEACYSGIVKQLKSAASFLNNNFDFNFVESSPWITDPKAENTTLLYNIEYTSHCPFVKDCARCLTLKWNQCCDFFNIFKKDFTLEKPRKKGETNSKLSITIKCSKKTCTCMSANKFEAIYAELHSFSYYLNLEIRDNYRKDIQYLVGGKEDENQYYNQVYRKEPLSIVQAATGAGKTHQAVRAALQTILNEDKVAILAFPTRKLLIQTEDLIKRIIMDPREKEHLGNVSLDDIDVYPITLAEDTRYSTLDFLFDKGLGRLPTKEPRRPTIFLTLHTYFRTKGDAPEVTVLAALILRECNNIFLIIDEAHIFVNSSTWKIPYESMVITKKDSFGLSSIIPWSLKDLASANLEKIEILKEVFYRGQEEQGGKVWKLNIFGKHNPISFKVDFEKNSKIRLNTTTFTEKIVQKNISECPQTAFSLYKNLASFEDSIKSWLDQLRVNSQAKIKLPEPETWISILLSLSYRPCVISYKPYNRKTGENITLEEYIQYHQKHYKSNVKSGTTQEHQKGEEIGDNSPLSLIFPKGNLPFTSDITGMNVFPVYLATRCKSCIFLSATLQEYHSHFIKIGAGQQKREIKHFFIDTLHDRILDTLILVVTRANWFTIFKKNFWKQILYILQQLSDFYSIGFCENNRQAEIFYDWLSCYSKDQILILSANEVKGLKHKYEYNTMQPVKTDNDVEEPSPKLSITSALGTMGTGINMPERKFILFNMGLYKPISAFWYCDTPMEAQQFLIQDLISSVQQTLGRNMRRSYKERTEKDISADRVTIIMGVNNFPGFLSYLEMLAKKSFKKIITFDLSTLEYKVVNISKKKGIVNSEDLKFEINKDEALNSSNMEGLSRVDYLRINSVQLLCNWLQGLYKDPLTFENFVKEIAGGKLLSSEDHTSYVRKKIQMWCQEKKSDSKPVTWRDLVRKFNLNRESEKVQEEVQKDFQKMFRESDYDKHDPEANVTDSDTNGSKGTIDKGNRKVRKDPGRKKGSKNKTPAERAAIQAELKARARPRGRPPKKSY